MPIPRFQPVTQTGGVLLRLILSRLPTLLVVHLAAHRLSPTSAIFSFLFFRHIELKKWVISRAAAIHVVSSPVLALFGSSSHQSIVQGRRSQQYEPLLLENEREAVADLLQYLESAYTSAH